jgi:hypothetical protein
VPLLYLAIIECKLLDKRVEYLYMRETVLGLPVDELTKKEALAVVVRWIKKPSKKMHLLVTAYSEFFC